MIKVKWCAISIALLSTSSIIFGQSKLEANKIYIEQNSRYDSIRDFPSHVTMINFEKITDSISVYGILRDIHGKYIKASKEIKWNYNNNILEIIKGNDSTGQYVIKPKLVNQKILKNKIEIIDTLLMLRDSTYVNIIPELTNVIQIKNNQKTTLSVNKYSDVRYNVLGQKLSLNKKSFNIKTIKWNKEK
jgi:hypothetical protein